MTAPAFVGTHRNDKVQTALGMVFDDSKGTNMFDGLAPLVKERDACGVGFIANTHSGGKHTCLHT